MKIIKNNQVIIFAIGIMLVTAGYMNFISTNSIDREVETISQTAEIGDATFVSSNDVIVNEKQENTETEDISNALSSEIVENEEKIETSNQQKNLEEDYFSNSKLERDNMYSQIVESYQKMIESNTITAEQKAIAQNEITKINTTKNAIMITENLIKTKGFKNAIILTNGESINVIISSESLKPEEIAQVQNIVSREMKAEIENIHISCK